MLTCVFDIETGPLPDATLVALMPEFEPAANLKDPDKIAADIARKKVKWKEDAALSALTGRVLAVGFLPEFSEAAEIISNDDEAALLASVWDYFRTAGGTRRPTFVGFNTFAFDLPFLVRRSWANGVSVPATIRQGRHWSDWLLDLRDVWQMGDRQASGSLDSICRTLGLGEKSGSGADFARLWQTDRAAATEYLMKDLSLTAALAGRLLR